MNLWERILSTLQHKIDDHSFTTWLKPTQQVSLSDGTLNVEVPSALFADWITKNYQTLIDESARELEMRSLRIHFTSRDPIMNRSDRDFDAAASPEPYRPMRRTSPAAHRSTRPAAPQRDLPPRAGPESTGLSPRFTFDTFVVSSCNQFASAAALAVTEQPSGAYNPLFIYSGVGLGKTHLMHAIGNQIARTHPRLRQRYTSTEKFMNQLISSIQYERTPDFKDRYRNIDVLLIDDIQFLAGKERTQEEFFHTFNALYESQKQIVLTSDCPPRDIPTLEERLRSRFEWGLIVDMQPPDLETKIAILQKKAQLENIKLPDEVAMFVASRSRSNIRELEGALIRLTAYSSMRRRPIDLEMAQETLKDLIDDRGRSVSIESIVKRVSSHFGIKTAELKSRNNARHIVFPRQVAMFLCKRLTDKSLPAIGSHFDKHHTTVIHAIRKVESMRGRDRDIERTLTALEEELA
jgi:chromosomal replication initiator protein